MKRWVVYSGILAACLAVSTFGVFAQDDGPPKLKRGKPAGSTDTTATSQTGGTSAPTASAPTNSTPSRQTAADDNDSRDPRAPTLSRNAPQPPPEPPGDEFLERAREAALNFTETLPNFLCSELVTRYQSDTRPARWRVMDTVSLDVVYEDGKETYRNIKVGSRPVKSLEETGGSWSTGDFATLLLGIFAPQADADFKPDGSERIDGHDAKRYHFKVSKERSGWTLDANGTEYTPGYEGTVWLEASTARALRLEMQANRLPSSFPFNAAEWSLDYAYTRINGQEYLLPAHSEILNCQRGSAICGRNSMDFRNYRKFTGESSITFDN